MYKRIIKATLSSLVSILMMGQCVLPAYAYEEKSSGEIINRITNDADSLSFIFGRVLNVISSLIGSLVIIVYIFINSWIIGLEILIIIGILFFTASSLSFS